VPKKNNLLNGKVVLSVVPWCQDFDAFRHFNPGSGNFNDDRSAVDITRSNGCPRHGAQPDLHRTGQPESRTAPDNGADSAGAARGDEL
jgi:hypothetical protein